jgi:hypothetical protein
LLANFFCFSFWAFNCLFSSSSSFNRFTIVQNIRTNREKRRTIIYPGHLRLSQLLAMKDNVLSLHWLNLPHR